MNTKKIEEQPIIMSKEEADKQREAQLNKGMALAIALLEMRLEQQFPDKTEEEVHQMAVERVKEIEREVKEGRLK